MEATGNYYLINHLVLITGLTDRTIRNYISNGILHGEKINGLWHFTPEEVESFIAHPAVRPSILAKHHSAVYDFLLENKKDLCETCMIVDIPGRGKEDPGCSDGQRSQDGFQAPAGQGKDRCRQDQQVLRRELPPAAGFRQGRQHVCGAVHRFRCQGSGRFRQVR